MGHKPWFRIDGFICLPYKAIEWHTTGYLFAKVHNLSNNLFSNDKLSTHTSLFLHFMILVRALMPMATSFILLKMEMSFNEQKQSIYIFIFQNRIIRYAIGKNWNIENKKLRYDNNITSDIATITILQYHPHFKFVDLMKNYH